MFCRLAVAHVARRRKREKAGTVTDRVRYGNCGIISGLMIRRLTRFIPTLSAGAALLVIAGSLAACRHKESPAPPVATPSVTLNHDKAPLGSPIEITYKFVVANDAHFDQDYRVMSHIVDADEQMMWDDDHLPPVPTTQWKPGQT